MMAGLSPLSALWHLAGVWVTALLFLAPLRRRPSFPLRIALCLGAGSLLYLAAALLLQWAGLTLWLEPLLRYGAVFLLFLQCAELPLKSALYYGIWTVMVHDLSMELGALLYRFFLGGTVLPWLPALTLWAIALTALGLTVARWMPDNGTYHAGPRQLSSAFLLWALFQGIS